MSVCSICGLNFSDKKNLLRHQNSSCQLPEVLNCYVCNECEKNFRRKDALLRHLRCVHTFASKSIKCFKCPKTFALKQYRDQHILHVHMNKKKGTRNKGKEVKCNMSANVRMKHQKTVHLRKMRQKKVYLHLDSFKCLECNRKYTRKNNLVQHIKHRHMGEPDSYECAYCARKYSAKYNLIRHIRSCTQSLITYYEKNSLHDEGKKYKCLLCGQTFSTPHHINKHYERFHSISYDYENLEFSSRIEFDDWMVNERKKYVQCYTDYNWVTETQITKLFRCHRSGEIRKKTEPKRIPKLVGSKKLNGFCPMFIILKENKINGQCSVKYQKTHIGHSLLEKDELPFIRLNEKEKLEIASKISIGASKDTMLTNNESGIVHEQSYSISLLDYIVSNIPMNCESNKSFSLRCNDDSVNIYDFVTKNQASILFYKARGELDERFPALVESDFALAYMDSNQERALMRYGHKIMAFDRSLGASPNDIFLHSISVQDVDYEGYPVAFLLSNRNDKIMINILLQHIKLRVGIVTPKIIMSDMRNSYFIAWLEEMGPVQYKLYSTWHVREAWRTNYFKISNKELRRAVKKDLENLSEEQNEELFEKRLSNLMRNDNVKLQKFLNYFRTFVNTKHCWAYCYRKDAGCNTNVNVERFHRTFKQKTTGQAKIKSVCECLFFLQTYLIWKENDIKKKLIRGKIGHKTRELRKRHKMAEEACSSKNKIIIEQINPTCWQVKINPAYWHVQSLQDDDGDDDDDDYDSLAQEVYTVQKLETKECSQYVDSDIVCSLPCTKCETCHHDFVCTCPDNSIRNYMCMHIHILGLYLLNKDANDEECFSIEQLVVEDENFDQQEQIIIVVQDFDEEETVHVVQNLNTAEDPLDEEMSLEDRRKNVVLKLQELLEDPHNTEVIDEIDRIFITPIQPMVKARNDDSG